MAVGIGIVARPAVPLIVPKVSPRVCDEVHRSEAPGGSSNLDTLPTINSTAIVMYGDGS